MNMSNYLLKISGKLHSSVTLRVLRVLRVLRGSSLFIKEVLTTESQGS